MTKKSGVATKKPKSKRARVISPKGSNGNATDSDVPTPPQKRIRTAGKSKEAAIPPAPTAKRVPDLETAWPGVFTDHTLRVLSLGLLVDYGVFYCLQCDPKAKGATYGIPITNISHHLKLHDVSPTRPDVKAALALIPEYDSWDGQDPPPAPDRILPPFPFLPIRTAENSDPHCPAGCLDCDGNAPYIWVTNNSRSTHYKKVHQKSSVKDIPYDDTVVAVQSFYSHTRNLRWFQVNTSLVQSTATYSASKATVAQNYITSVRSNRPSNNPLMGGSGGLSRDNPFIHRQGWPQHLEGKSAKDLVSLVEPPPKTGDWGTLNGAGWALFQAYQDTIGLTSDQVLHGWLDTDAKTAKYTKAFKQLDVSSGDHFYSGIFIQFVSLILRSQQRLELDDSNESLYTPKLTPAQSQSATTLLKLMRKGRDVMEIKLAMHSLALTCFAPKDAANMTFSHANNIVNVFIMLKCIQPDGSYRPSKDLLKATSAIQYAFRSTLLYEATIQGSAPQADRESIFLKYKKFLETDSMVTPFGAFKSLRRQLLADAATTYGLGLLHWIDEEHTECTFKGHTFKIKGVSSMALAMLDRAETMLEEKVCFKIPLPQLGWVELDLSLLIDDKGNSSLGYSVWNDTRNVAIQAMKLALHEAFITHPSLDGHFWSKQLPNGLPQWHDHRRTAWLEDVGQLSLHLLGCTHLWSGQMRRATEILTMRNHNVEARLRNLMAHGKDLMFHIGYSKTAAITGRDRMDIHGLPPRLTRLLTIYQALIQPLAVEWVGDIFDKEDNQSDPQELEMQPGSPSDTDSDYEYGTDNEAESPNNINLQSSLTTQTTSIASSSRNTRASGRTTRSNQTAVTPVKRSTLQHELTFSNCGLPFSNYIFTRFLRQFAKEFIGVSWGVSPCRHLWTAIQRDILWIEFEKDDDIEEKLEDWQAGHTTKLARRFYAVRDGDWNLSNSDTISKYMEISRVFHAWLNGEARPRKETVGRKLLDQVSLLQAKVEEQSEVISELRSEVQGLTDSVTDLKSMLSAFLQANKNALT